MTDANRPYLVRPADGADRVWRDRSEAAVKRLARLERAGLVRAVRVGSRGDRWYVTSSLDAYVDGVIAESTDEADTA